MCICIALRVWGDGGAHEKRLIVPNVCPEPPHAWINDCIKGSDNAWGKGSGQIGNQPMSSAPGEAGTPAGDTRIKTAALGSQARPSGRGPDQGLGTPEGPPAQAALAGRPAGLTLPALRIAKVAAPAAAGLFTAAPELQRDSPRADSPQRGTGSRIVRAQRVPVGTRGMVPDLGFGGSGTSTPTSSSLQYLISIQNQARINVIG